MKSENKLKQKTLEILEKDVWPPLNNSDESHLIRTCNELRKKPLKDFTVEDLRIMIGQDIGLGYLIPIALEVLSENILAEGHYYEGDLLNSVLSSDREYWKKEIPNHVLLISLFEKNKDKIKYPEVSKEMKKEIISKFEAFLVLNV